MLSPHILVWYIHLKNIGECTRPYLTQVSFSHFAQTDKSTNTVPLSYTSFHHSQATKSKKGLLQQASGRNSKLFCRASLLSVPSPTSPAQTLHWPLQLPLKCSFNTRGCPSVPPPHLLGCQPCYLCACLPTLKQSRSGLPPTDAPTVPHFHTARFHIPPSAFFFFFLQVLNWKFRTAKGLAVLDKRSLCFPALPPCPETTRLSFLLRWLWEGPADKSHASKCLLTMTMRGTWSRWRPQIKAHMLWPNLSVVGPD